MLVFILALAVFLSVVWGVFAIQFVVEALQGISLLDAGILNVILYTLFVSIPVVLIWGIYGFINQTIYNSKLSKQMQKLFAQMKKNQEYSDLLAKVMLANERESKSAVELNRFVLLLADLNELLSDFIARQHLASEEQIEYLWTKVQNGGKWSFGKVVIENFNRQPNFKQKVAVNALADNMLGGIIMEFCARYQTIIGLLEKYDAEKIFLEIMETGVMGKVFAILSPICSEVKRSRSVAEADMNRTALKNNEEVATDQRIEPKDEFSLALERSFGAEASFPSGDRETTNHKVDWQESEMSETQKTLNVLKKEWRDDEASSASKDKVDDLTYPFGSWTDAQNYQK